MTKFSCLNKKYKFEIEDDCLYGDLLTSITKESVLKLIDCIYNYCLVNSILQLHIGYDAGQWSKVVVNDFIIPRLKELSFKTLITSESCPIFQLSWLNSQTTKRSLGLYIGSDSHRDSRLGFYFRHQNGNPFSYKDIKNLVKNHINISVTEIKKLVDEECIIPVDFSGYTKYLKDKKYLSEGHDLKRIYCDLMFGSGDALMKELKQLNPNIHLYNSPSEIRRFKYYLPKPTSNTLKMWISDQNSTSYYFALDGDSDCLGVYDLAQKLEISPSGIYLLLLYYLKFIKKIENGRVLISKCLNSRVKKYAKKLGYECSFISRLSEIGKYKDIIAYGDEYGGFWVSDSVKDRNPIIAILALIETCEYCQKSPGELLDSIHDELKIVCYYHNIYIDSHVLTKKALLSDIQKSNLNILFKTIKKGHIDEYRCKDRTNMKICENKKLETTEIYIESKNLDTIKTITDYINKLI